MGILDTNGHLSGVSLVERLDGAKFGRDDELLHFSAYRGGRGKKTGVSPSQNVG